MTGLPPVAWVLLAQVVSTLPMVGLIWFVQIVHYPLFNRVGAEHFRVYEQDHQNLTGLVVIPFMLLELAAAGLGIMVKSDAIPNWTPWVGLGLVLVIWGSTFFLQVPQHSALGLGFSEGPYRTLVATNWVRTIAWTLRGILVPWMLVLTLQSGR